MKEEAYILYIDGERHPKVYRTLGHAKCALTNFGFYGQYPTSCKFTIAIIAKLEAVHYHEFVPEIVGGKSYLKEVGLKTNGE